MGTPASVVRVAEGWICARNPQVIWNGGIV
jgi:hypothetical protein